MNEQEIMKCAPPSRRLSQCYLMLIIRQLPVNYKYN